MTFGCSIGNRCLRWPTVAALSGALLASCTLHVHSPFARYAPASNASVTAAPATEVDLVVAATTDVHGRLRSWDYYADAPDPVRGLTRAASIVDSLRGAHPGRVVLVDAGDLLQGNPLTYVAARMAGDSLHPHPVAAAMNVMQYDAAAIGNHEFNYGVPTLRRMIADARFPMLAANALTTTGKHAFTSWTMVRRAGVKIAIVGGTTPGSDLWDRENLAVADLVIRDIVPAVRDAVAEARRAGADVVVVLLHSGLAEPSSYDTVTTHVASENVSARVAREVPGIDLIVYGHSHKELADTVIGGTLLMQPKNWATSVGVAHLELVRDGERWRVAEKRSSLVSTAGHAENAGVLAATEKAHRATVAYVTTPIGTTPVAWRADSARVVDTPLIDFILDVEREAANTQLASTAAFSLDANLAAGPITIARLAALYPYDNTLRKIWITGRQLRDYLEFSARYFRVDSSGRVGVDPRVPGYNFDIVGGADYTIDLSRPIGSRITKLEYRGKPITATDSFTFALNNYRQTGGGGYAMLSGSRNIDDRQLEIRQLLIDAVHAKRVLRPEDHTHRNWELTPNAAIGQAYAAMHRLPGEGGPARVASPIVGPRLRIIATNDVHGALEPRPDDAGILRGGLAYVAGAIERAEHECAPPECHWLLLDGGDEFQGTPASNLAFGRPVVDIFNHLGLAAAALGNHEFDWGQDTLRSRMTQAHYAFLGANVRDTLGRSVPWIRADTMVLRGPSRIGIIGLSTVSTPTSTRASNTAGLRFLEPAPIVDSLAQSLRARGATMVVVVAHAGAFCDRTGTSGCSGEIVDLAQHLTQHVDAIVSGHTHSLVNATVKGIPIVQGRSRGQAIDVVDIPLDSGASAVAHHEVRDVLPERTTPDTTVRRIVAAAVAAVAPIVSQPVARIAEAMRKSASGSEEQLPLGNLIADAMRVEGKGDIGIMNNGGIRASLRAGPATYGDLFEVQPFGNILYRVSVGGRDLRAYLERLVGRRRPIVHVSGVVVQYDTARAPGSRLVSVQVGDAPLADDRLYTLVLNDFEYTGGSGLGLGNAVRRAENLNLVDLDAFIDYLRSAPQPVQPPTDNRFVIVPAP
jgi:2',3'-cyclic-nucleotide 2'-phosphodiesterase (5'-nucleotidase family)